MSAVYDNLPPFAEDMYAVFEELEEKFPFDEGEEMRSLAAEVSTLMMQVDTKMNRMNEILEETLGKDWWR